MRKILIIAILVAFASSVMATTEAKDTSKVKTGWNFGILPSIAYDADLGFQFGALSNIYYYGDGSQYPEYIHSFYVEAAYTTKRYGLFRFFYDSKYLIPDHRLTVDVSYLPDAMCDFYGYNGYPTLYHMGWHNAKKDSSEYLSRAFYKYKRDLVRVAADIEGTISGDWKWNAGLGVLGYMIDECDIDMLNGKRQPSDQKYLDPSVQGLYELYRNWGIIKPGEANGGWHPYVRGGITFDSRDKRSNPSRGIYADAFFTYSAAFGNQTEYNHLKFNFNFRHYVPIYKDRVTLAYRIGTQNTIAGESPFYMNTYLNTLFIQRVLYEGLGGGNSLRGIMRNRILANGFAYANVELRTKIVNFDIGKQHFYIGLNPFFDLGVVTQPYKLDETEIRTAITAYNVATGRTDKYEDYFNLSRKETYMPHSAAGIGLKVAMNENFILSVDWATALNKQDNGKMMNFYVKMGYLF